MKSAKIMAFTAAFIMLAVGCVAYVDLSSVSDAQGNDDTINIYFDGTGTWQSASYYKFNAFQAIQAACGTGSTALNLYIESSETDWTETTDANGTYPNPDYGTIEKVGKYVYDEDEEMYVLVGVTDSFHIYGSNDDGDWEDITDYALGWFRPFTDYANYAKLVYNNTVVQGIKPAYANIAIQMNGTSLSGISTASLKSLTDPVGRSDCTYTFVLKDPQGLVNFGSTTYYARINGAGQAAVQISENDLRSSSGVTAYGYGSDAFLALVHAVNGATFGQQEIYELNGTAPYTYYTNYSWMEYLFGVGTVTTDLGDGHYEYKYWASYKGTGSTATYTMFNLGYHSQIPDAYSHVFDWMTPSLYVCDGNTFTMEYTVS